MIIHNPILTGSFTVNGTDVASITSSAASITAINAYTASQNILNGTYATTGSNTFAGIQTVNSNLVVTGSITAQTLVVQTITSSVDFVTGSTRFGSSLSTSTHQFTGSVSITGSLSGVGATFSGNNATNTTENSSVSWNDLNGNLMGKIVGYRGANGNDGNLRFYVSNTPTLALTISGSGYVGIGTTSPQSALSFASTSHIGVATVDGSDNGYLTISGGGAGGGDRGASIYMSGNERPTYGGQLAIIAGDAGTSGFINLITGGAERMRITSAGNVGINCTPTTALTIRPINGSTNALSILDPVGTAQRIAQISFGNATNDGEISLDSNGTNNVRISSNRASYFNGGNVLIGTSSALPVRADANLQVFNSTTLRSTNYYENLPVLVLFSAVNTSGGLYVEFTTSNGTRIGSITRDGGSNVAYNTSSDIRLKKNIINSLSSINKINSIQVRSFDWISDDKHQDFGFIAQELIEVAPEAVTKGIKEEDIWGVDNSKLVPILVKAIQELQAQITELKNK